MSLRIPKKGLTSSSKISQSESQETEIKKKISTSSTKFTRTDSQESEMKKKVSTSSTKIMRNDIQESEMKKKSASNTKVTQKDSLETEVKKKSLDKQSTDKTVNSTMITNGVSHEGEMIDEVKPSVDRAKLQRTFSQSNQDECLCKICNTHVYQMEKLKAEKNIFHKNCFRCKECNKLLTVDSYSSNEGDIYCKPHFRQLFQPKARFGGEDAAPRKQRRNEMVIRENIPAELPPDVVRSDSKPNLGLDNIQLNLGSIKSRFEDYREEHRLPSTADVCTLQRSASLVARLAKYQSAISGGENENGELSASDSEEECNEDPSVVKPSKYREKVVFSGMSNLKSQWETGSVAATKEERIEEKKEELNKLRQRICLGRSESMKQVYQQVCEEKTKSVAPRTVPVDVGREIKANRLKEKFEKGELVSEVKEENLEKVRKEREEDLSVFTEPGTARDAKKLFKEIDASSKSTVLTTSSKLSLNDRPVRSLHSPVKDTDVVKCSEPVEKEDIPVNTTDVTQRFKFFENYSESPKERKRFQITPPREPVKEDSPEREIPHDPNVIRAADTVNDIPQTDVARKMLDKFKALENERPTVPVGPKPLKRITPPREYTKMDSDREPSPELERDPNIVRCSYKVEDDIIVDADKAKSLKAKFENWDVELNNKKNEDDEEEEDFLPQVDTTKTLRAKFEAIKEEILKPAEKPKSRVNRFI